MAVSAKSNNRKREFDKPIDTEQVVNTKIKFDDDSDTESKPVNKHIVFEDDSEVTAAVTKPKGGKKGKNAAGKQKESDIGSKWYQEVSLPLTMPNVPNTFY